MPPPSIWSRARRARLQPPTIKNTKQPQPDKQQQLRVIAGRLAGELHARIEQLFAELGVYAIRAKQVDDEFFG